MLGTGTDISIPSVSAESIHNNRSGKAETEGHGFDVNAGMSEVDKNSQIKDELSGLNKQIKRVNQAIQDNHDVIMETAQDIEAVNSQIKQLKNEISDLEVKIEKRSELLHERMRSYQESGVNVSYLEVLLESANFGDFINRAGTVAKILQADRDLLEQQDAEKKDYESKLVSLEQKQLELNTMKTEFEGMQTQAIEQKNQYTKLQEQLKDNQVKKNENDLSVTQQKDQSKAALTDLDSSQATGQEYINTVITEGYKYIGNSVYVFGGGRSQYDIENGRFDCSGFVHWAFTQAGIDVGLSTDSIKNSGQQVSEKDLQPGDLVFFDTYKKDGHVGIYVGNGKFIGSQSSTGVAIADMSKGYWNETFNGRVVRIAK
jgi:cell wall-associated NlpC family hydrolase